VETRNRILHLGAAWRAAPQTVLKLAWYHDRGRNLNGVAGRDGNKDTAVASGEYALSRRTSLYAAAFSNRFTDGYRLDPVNIAALGRDPAASSTSGLSLGVRHDF
jgi:predicted porin